MQLAGVLGLGKFVAQAVYTAHIAPGAADSRVCRGPRCFRLTHVIVAGLCVTAAGGLALVAWRSRGLYRRIWQHEAAAAGAAPQPAYTALQQSVADEMEEPRAARPAERPPLAKVGGRQEVGGRMAFEASC